QIFLDALKPKGLLAVSRWHNPDKVSETNRLLSLATAALLARGVATPEEHLVLVSAGNVATLLVSPSPLSSADVAAVRAVSANLCFRVLLAPGTPPEDALMRAIVISRSQDALLAAVADPAYDFSPPTDRRPYFFNLLRPTAFLRAVDVPAGVVSVTRGNIQ